MPKPEKRKHKKRLFKVSIDSPARLIFENVTELDSDSEGRIRFVDELGALRGFHGYPWQYEEILLEKPDTDDDD